MVRRNVTGTCVKEILPIIFGIGILSLILIPTLTNRKGRTSTISTEFTEEKSVEPTTNIKPDYELFLCLGVDHGAPIEPKTSFLTTDKIHCLIRWCGITHGNHKAEFYWINPGGETQEYYKKDFVVTTGDRYNTWSWLKLREGEFIVDNTFAGKWSVQVFLDGEFVAEEKFRVQ